MTNATITRYGAGVAFWTSSLPLSLRGAGGRPMYEVQQGAFEDRAVLSPSLGRVVFGVLGPPVTIASEADPESGREVRLLARTEAFDHLQPLQGGGRDGLWLADMIARSLRVEPGDSVTLRLPGGSAVEAPVTGIYRALHAQPTTGYWRAYYGEIYRQCLQCEIPPPFAVGDREVVLGLLRELEAPAATFTLDAPAARADLTLEEVRGLDRFATEFLTDISDRDHPLHEVFRCCGPRVVPYHTDARFTSHASRVIIDVQRRFGPVEAPIRVLAGVGVVVAVAVVAAAGRFTMAARRTEATLLAARGMSPATIGVKAVLEALVPAAVGGAAGLGLAVAVLVTLGPGRLGGDVVRAAVLSAVAWAVAVVLVGLVSAAEFAARGPRDRRAVGGARFLGYGVAALLAGWSLWFLLRGDALLPGDPAQPAPAPALLPLFPIAFIGGFGALGAVAIRAAFGRLRPRTGRMGPATFLAVHRLAAAPALVVLLMAVGALSLGVFLNGGSMVASLRTTVETKARVIVGSEAAVRVPYGFQPSQPLGFPVTVVTRWREAGSLSPPGRSFDLLAVDPATFASAAAWDPSFAQAPPGELVAPLDPAEEGGPIPIVVSGVDGLLGTDLTLEVAGRQLPARVVGRASTFPSQLQVPLVVMHAGALPERFGLLNPLAHAPALTEVWMRAPPNRVRSAVALLGIPQEDVLTTEEVEGTPTMAAVISTFALLNALAITVGLLTVVILLMYLQARQRGQVVAYALSLRMGLSDASHRRAVFREVGVMMGCALALGAALAAVASAVLIGRLDPVTSVPPPPILEFPVAIIPVAVAGLAAVSWVAGRLTNRRARQTDLAGVMRGGA